MTMFLSIADAARECSLDPTTIRKAIYARELPANKVGRKILVDADDLRAWVKSMPEASPEDGAA